MEYNDSPFRLQIFGILSKTLPIHTDPAMLRATLRLHVRPTMVNSVRTRRGGNINNYRQMQAGFRRQNRIMQDAEAFEEDPAANFDANYFNVHQSHKEHELELKLRQEQRKYYTIRHKYFKTPKMPNMLTWAEKEHIRNLHTEDPAEWTAERLAEAFPATQEIILKVLRAGRWAPANMQAVEKHDSRVKHNWDLFKENKLDGVTPELRECLQRFSNRSFDASQNAYAKARIDQIQFQFPKPRNKEFSSIVSSLEKAKERLDKPSLGQTRSSQLEERAPDPKMLTSRREVESASQIHMNKMDRQRSMTFEQLMQRSSKPAEPEPSHMSIDLSESAKLEPVEPVAEVARKDVSAELTMHGEQSSDLTASPDRAKEVEPIRKYNRRSVSLDTDAGTHLGPSQIVAKARGYSLRIRIPKDKWKKGNIYQKYDSFYDHTGLFLYRVPGLHNDGAGP